MLVMDNIMDVRDWKILVPFYHKGHLSFKSGTGVTLCYLPHEADGTDGHQMAELAISPFKFGSWRDLWRINATLFERTGVVSKLLSVIQDAGLNVLTEESGSSENRRYHRIEVIVDASSYVRNRAIPEEHIDDFLQSFERRVISYCINDIPLRNGKPRLKVRRMKGMLEAFERYRELDIERLDKPSLCPASARSKVENGRIKIPQSIQNTMKDRGSIRCFLVSDTKERLLRVFFPRTEFGYTYLKVEHNDQVGALSGITKALSSDFDILISLSRISDHEERNHFEALIFSPKLNDREQESDRRKLIECLLNQEYLTDFDLLISYPDKVDSKKGEGIPPRGRECHREKIAIDSELQSPTSMILEKRIKHIIDTRETLDIAARTDQGKRLKYLREALEREGSTKTAPEIFVSYDFGRSDLFEIVKSEVSAYNGFIITGENPDEADNMRNSIIQRIQQCDGFIGVWTGNLETFSPWLLWELGVAQAYGIQCRLLISEEVDSSRWRINRDSAHYIFKELAFEKHAKRAVGNLIFSINQT